MRHSLEGQHEFPIEAMVIFQLCLSFQPGTLLLKPRQKQVELEALPPIDVENHQLLPCFTHPEVWSFNIPHLHPLKCLHLITML